METLTSTLQPVAQPTFFLSIPPSSPANSLEKSVYSGWKVLLEVAFCHWVKSVVVPNSFSHHLHERHSQLCKHSPSILWLYWNLEKVWTRNIHLQSCALPRQPAHFKRGNFYLKGQCFQIVSHFFRLHYSSTVVCKCLQTSHHLSNYR